MNSVCLQTHYYGNTSTNQHGRYSESCIKLQQFELTLSRNINHNTQYTQVYTLEQSGRHISVNFNGRHNIDHSH